MQDEIERRTAEVEQKTAQTMEQARLLDLANDAIFVRSAQDRISYWNQGAKRLYGWTKDEALGRSTHELLRTRFPVPLSEIEKTDRWEGELLQVKRDGSEITVASRWTTLRDHDGKFVGWLEILYRYHRPKAGGRCRPKVDWQDLELAGRRAQGNCKGTPQQWANIS